MGNFEFIYILFLMFSILCVVALIVYKIAIIIESKKEPPKKNEVEQKKQEAVGREEFKEEIQPTEEKKENVTVRKIRIIKKQ